jgi:cytochrome c553
MVVESLPEPINFTGGMDPLSYAGTFTLERVLGTVPVEADGSAFFEAPALRSLFFVALDEHDLSVKRMQSFTTVQPGETLSCVGCHEHRTTAPPLAKRGLPLAAQRRASTIEACGDVPEVVDFPRDIQPILDRNCLKCHDYDKREGGVILTGDHGPLFSHSYYTLTVWRQLADGRNRPQSNYPPRTLGSGGSPLIKMLTGSHYNVHASDRERRIVQTWLDLGAPYPGTYAALGTGSIGGYINNAATLNNDAAWPETVAARSVFAERCTTCHNPQSNPIAHTLSDENGLSFWQPAMGDRRLEFSRHIIFNLSRPEKSLALLAPLARSAGGYGTCKPKGANSDGGVFRTQGDPDYRRLLAMIAAGKRKLEEIKRFDMPDFKPRAEYVREMKRFQVLPQSFDAEKQPLDCYDTDRRYWNSFIYRPN